MEKKLFDEIVLLITSLALSYFGLSLSIRPLQYKAFAATIEQPVSRALARAPVWVIRSLGFLLVSGGLLFFYKLITKWR
jgi:hypothetical protein